MENFEQLSNEQLLEVKGGNAECDITGQCTPECGCGSEERPRHSGIVSEIVE